MSGEARQLTSKTVSRDGNRASLWESPDHIPDVGDGEFSDEDLGLLLALSEPSFSSFDILDVLHEALHLCATDLEGNIAKRHCLCDN